MIGRRSLLKMIGASPAAALMPTAEAAKLAGISRLAGLGSVVHGVEAYEEPPQSGDPDAVSGWVIANGLPAFVKEAMRRERRVPHGLDPDLVANRSFSMAAKVAIQRDRDFDRACRDTVALHKTNIARRALGKVLGQELYW